MSLQKPCPTCRQPLPLAAAFCRRCGSPATVERSRRPSHGGRLAAVVFGGALVTAGFFRYHAGRVYTPVGWTVSSERAQPAEPTPVPDNLRDWTAAPARSTRVYHLDSGSGRYEPSVTLPPGYPSTDVERRRR